MDDLSTNGAPLDPGHMALQALQVQFLERLPARLDEIRAQWNSLSPGHFSNDQAEDLHRAVHSLTGTAGIFGLHDLSRAARAFEHLLHLALQPGQVVDEVDWPALRLAQERLQAASRSPAPAEAAPANAAPVLFTREVPSTDPVWRVLVVDDDPMALEAHAGILEAAGMEVNRVCVAADAEQAVIEFEPDVVLLDVYMPGMSGPELAATLREREDLLHLSILFLSAETDLTQQLLALDLGGDGFLIKPAQPAHLVAAVAARARRSRHNRSVRRRLETTLYEREREHLALNEHAIVSIADAGGHITYVNDRYCEISGYSRDELLGRTHSMGRSGVHSREFHAHLWSEVSAGRVWQGEICNRSKDGSLYWVATTITPFMDAQGRPYQYVNIRTDITHLKDSQAEIRRQRDMQRLVGKTAARMVSTAPGDIDQAIETALRASGEQLGADRAYLFLFSRDGERVSRFQGWNAPGFEPLYSHDVNQPSPRLNQPRPWFIHDTPWLLEQFMGESLLRIHDVTQIPATAASDRDFLQSFGVNAVISVPMLVQGRLVGLIAYGSARARPDWLAPEIELLKVLSEVIGSALARRRAERALRESEARMHFLVSASPVTIYTCQVKPPHALTYISPNLTRLMGHDPETIMKIPGFWSDNIHPDDHDRVLGYAKNAVRKRVYQQEYRFRAQDGSYRWVQDEQRVVRSATGAPTEIVGYWMDITERKRIEGELSKFNDELEHRVAEQTHSVIESERMARATLDALSSHVVILDAQGVILAANHAWSRAQPNPYEEGTVIGEGSNYLDYCDQFAHSRHVRPEAVPIAQGVRAVIAGAKSEFLHEYTVFSPGKQRWYVCRVERFPGDGEVRVVVSHENVTQMKLIERQQMRSQRLESLGTLAGGVAHDLNNALAPILMGMDMLKEDYPGEAKVLEMIQASARRGADMVKQLLAFAKGADGERVVLPVSRIVGELETLMRGSFPKSIQLVIDNDTSLPGVMGDPTQLHQVLLNLCVNARDAMPDGGTLKLRGQWVDVDADYAQLIPDASPGRYVVLRVSDTGTGIPPEDVDRIFDPFFTTKSLDKGTGLGLATVLGIVRGHKGFVQVYSQPGEGSSFAVYLPAHQIGQQEATLVVKDALFHGNGETVLFVDDEAAVREVGQAVLTRLHFKPLVATDGAHGLMQAVAHQHELRVVVTDLHMPNVDGLAFVRALRRSVPKLPVIVCSGRVDDVVATELKTLGVKVRLDKPFSEAQLSQALREVLGTPAK